MKLWISTLYPHYEDASETVDLDAIGGVEDRIMCEYNHSFVPINDSNVNPVIDTNGDEAIDDENEEEDNESDVNNNDTTLDDDDVGIIIDDASIEYDDLNIPITVGHLRMGGRHTVFDFYTQLVRTFNKCRKKLGIICVLCAMALDGTNYYQ